MHPARAVTLAAALALGVVSGCGGSDNDATDPPAGTAGTPVDAPADTAPVTSVPRASDAAPLDEELFPDVLDATATRNGDTWTIAATLSSPYDSPERYANAWRVVGPDGTVYGERPLTHDHGKEQPFTRSQSGIEIPDDVDVVTIEGRDQVSGWGGATFTLTLPR